MATAIEFNHVSKLYRLGLVSTGTFREDIKRWWITSVQKKEDPYLTIGETNDRGTKGESNFVWALRDIDFKVEQGDVVGIIGKNGAGKSTLLKLLSRVTGPTTGTIRAHGRIGSLLEVGTGFHGEMTGRENIFMNGAILGMTRNEIQAKLDEIIDFSGCERYIDTPVKRYSSGMTVRLGFAVAAFLEPEILVVDEVLAVGDAEFQKKAIGKMKDVSQGQGRTVLFVSHNMGSIRQLCTRGIVLDKGSVIYDGNTAEAIGLYMRERTHEGGVADKMIINNPLVHIDSVMLNGSTGNHIYVSPEHNWFDIHISGSLDKEQKLSLELMLRDHAGAPLFFFSPHHNDSPLLPKGPFELNYRITLPSGLTKGLYYGGMEIVNSMTSCHVNLHSSFIVESEGVTMPSGYVMDNKYGSVILN